MLILERHLPASDRTVIAEADWPLLRRRELTNELRHKLGSEVIRKPARELSFSSGLRARHDDANQAGSAFIDFFHEKYANAAITR